jgi:methenyltetrahydrofolate cyclohydrolase
LPAVTALGIDEALGALGSVERAAAAGTAAAFAGALAAAVVAKTARASERGASAAQAVALQRRLCRLAESDAEVLGQARATFAEGASASGERRDFELGRALRLALAVPLEIGEACADVAVLAADERASAVPDHVADLAAAASIAAGAAGGAARLVVVNLAAAPDGPEVTTARRVAARAADVAASFGDI